LRGRDVGRVGCGYRGFTRVGVVALLLALVLGGPSVAPAAAQQPTEAVAAGQLVGLLNSVPAAPEVSYGTVDNTGQQVATIKIIPSSCGSGYIGVYHYEDPDGEFYVRVGTSSDLLHWTYAATLATNASQPTIAALSNGGFLVASEKYIPSVLGLFTELGNSSLTSEVSQVESNPTVGDLLNPLAAATGVENLAYGTTHLEFHFYPNCSDLLSGIATETFDAPMSLSDLAEGTPSLGSISLGAPSTVLAPMSNSTIQVGFHYYDTTIDRDRNATGVLTDFSNWTEQTNTPLNSAFPATVHGNIGGRDYLNFEGYPFTIIEAENTEGDFGTWRVYLYDDTTDTLTPLAPSGGSESFGNPKVTVLTDPAGQCALVVSLFVFNPGNGPNPAGPLIYYNPFSPSGTQQGCAGAS